MAIVIAILLIGLISILGLVTVAQYYWAKRDAQKVADMAALSAAQHFNPDCGPASVHAANVNAKANWDSGARRSITATCGNWSPANNPPDTHFIAGATSTAPANAIKVVAHVTPNTIIPEALVGNSFQVNATAIATRRSDPIATFSVGSRLLGLDENSALNDLLDSTLGTRLGLKLLSYQGIANTNVSLLGLKNLLHLDAGTVHGVLNTNVNVGNLLDAVVTLLQQGGNTANVDIVAIDEQVAHIKAEIGDVDIKLGDILNVDSGTSNPDAALDVDVNAGSLINAALMAANSKHALQLNLPINLLGLAEVGLKLAVIEPPKIGVGRPGYDANGQPFTVAHTAQIRLRLDVKLLDANSLGGNKALLNILELVKITLPDGQLVDIPLNLEVVPAEAWLDNIQCHRPAAGGMLNTAATLKVKPGVLTLFLGNLPDSTYENKNMRWQDIVDDAIADGSAYAKLLHIDIYALLDILHVGTELKAYASTPVVRPEAKGHQFVMPNGNASLPKHWSVGTGKDLLAAALNGLLSPKNLKIKLKLDGLGLVGDVVSGVVNGALTIVGNLLPILKPVLMPVLNALDHALIGPLLRILGVNVGAADVSLMSINCNTGVQLVY